MPSECDEADKQCENMTNNIPSEFLNSFGFIDYKHDGSVPWTVENIFLSSEFRSVTKILGIDCEMVGVGNFRISVLGRVSIVNEYGFCVYDTFVNPLEEITDFATQYSGIRAEDLVDAPPIDSVLNDVASIVKGRVLVGHSIHNDLDVLKLSHPIGDIRDTANYFQNHGGNKRTPALRTLVKEYFNTTIQEGEHSSIQDAQATLRLYLLFREEWEKDALERRRNANLADTVTDITCMNVQPRPPDLFTESESVFFRPINLVGPYYSSGEYKDIHFRLLMEDFQRPLRQDIQRLKQRNKLMANRFKNIRIAAGNSTEESVDIEVKSNKTLLVPIQANRLEDIDWNDREIFLTGSLVILSPDDFRTIKCAKVVDIGKNQRDDSAMLHLYVNFLMDGPSWKVTDRDRFEMIESKAFFLPYEFTLNYLQDLDLDEFPLKKYIVDVVTKADTVPNLLNDTVNRIDFSILMDSINDQTEVRARPLDFEQWPSANQLNLDESQYEGLQKALTQELTIIQGPPGTGKSYVSLQIVKILLTNKWMSSAPILIVSYTNHALDELLEAILKFMTDRMHGGNLKKAEQSLLRIGGGSKSDAIIPCTLTFKREKLKEKRLNKRLVKSLEKALAKVNSLDFTNKLVDRGIINFKLLPQVVLAKLETNERTKDIFKLWIKSHNAMEQNVLSWFGLNHQSIEVRPVSLTAISDKMFLLLCDNLESILSETFPKIPITLDEIKGKTLHDTDQDQQYLIRWGFYLFLVGELDEVVKATQNELALADKANEELEVYAKENATVKQARVIGMTTTGAVKYKKMVETKMKSSIMLVEEAAHVLEAYVVASLTKHCTQLILIGDHKQLRPMIADHNLAEHGLDVSLMERLVLNGIHQNVKNWTQLKVQHRMRTDIAKLICPLIYDELENHSDVELYPNVIGCSKNLFFVHHENPENLEAQSRSRFNTYEARYIIGLLTYFMECGYSPAQVTVICTYAAQKTLIENTIENNALINQIQISTVDGYQGKQNDLIILSLVRSNTDNNVGFLKTDNRVCVALSRARHGLIMIGNMNILAQCSDTWSKIHKILIDGSNIGEVLPLHHPQKFSIHDNLVQSSIRRGERVHTRRSTTIMRDRMTTTSIAGTMKRSNESRASPQMIPSATESDQIAGTLPCGHVGIDGKCNAKVKETLPCGHEQTILCSEKGKTTKCGSVVHKSFQCGHSLPVACHKLSVAICTREVKKTFPCGHQDIVPCQQQNCKRNFSQKLQCGHIAEVWCSQRYVMCSVAVNRKLPCGHQKTVLCKNAKSNFCDTKIEERLSCGHARRTLCSEKGKTAKCGSAIQKEFECGHSRSIACHQLSSAACTATVRKTFSCGHEDSVPCQQKHCRRKVAKPLQCGHVAQVFCTQRNTKVVCSVAVNRKLPCGHQKIVLCNNAKSNFCDTKIEERLSCGHARRTLCSEKGKTAKCGSAIQKEFECGHSRSIACHQLSSAACTATVRKTFSCGHEDSVPCQQKHCRRKVAKPLQCGHVAQVFCTQRNTKVVCLVAVKRNLPCGHQKIVPCHTLTSTKCKCDSIIDEQLPCGHKRRILCGENGKGPKCGSVVQKQMACGHVTPVPCHRFATANCTINVTKIWSCGHTATVLCSERNSKKKCPAIIEHKYPCGHLHRFSCLTGEKMAKNCGTKVERMLLCGHVQESACHQNPLSIKCKRLVNFAHLKIECHKFSDVVTGLRDALAEVQLAEQLCQQLQL